MQSSPLRGYEEIASSCDSAYRVPRDDTILSFLVACSNNLHRSIGSEESRAPPVEILHSTTFANPRFAFRMTLSILFSLIEY